MDSSKALILEYYVFEESASSMINKAKHLSVTPSNSTIQHIAKRAEKEAKEYPIVTPIVEIILGFAGGFAILKAAARAHANFDAEQLQRQINFDVIKDHVDQAKLNVQDQLGMNRTVNDAITVMSDKIALVSDKIQQNLQINGSEASVLLILGIAAVILVAGAVISLITALIKRRMK